MLKFERKVSRELAPVPKPIYCDLNAVHIILLFYYFGLWAEKDLYCALHTGDLCSYILIIVTQQNHLPKKSPLHEPANNGRNVLFLTTWLQYISFLRKEKSISSALISKFRIHHNGNWPRGRGNFAVFSRIPTLFIAFTKIYICSN